ncbi:MAG: ThiF family adenylyltransferase, partial [Oscillospiraceae bacterium]
MDWLDRQRRLIGAEATKRLTKARVAVVGLGGVGGGAVEALARCGIGALLVMDRDVFDVTNLNRQLLATDKTIG